MEPMNVVAFSGGKDSTCMALAMQERGERIDRLLITPTGDELPEMTGHWEAMSKRIGVGLTVPKGPTLDEAIEANGALPNFRMRFCTRMVKIQPAIAWVRMQSRPVRMFVGLRADEQERVGIISGDLDERYPLREWGFGLREVNEFLKDRGVTIPERTDCARCYHQRIGEWYKLWRDHRDTWLDAESQEAKHGATFRTPGRDSWPTSLVEMRAKFESGLVPTSALKRERADRMKRELDRPVIAGNQIDIFGDEEQAKGVCRICSL